MKNGNYEYKLLYSGQLSPIARLNDEDRVVEEYVYGSRVNVPEYMIKDGRKYRFITDHRGSVRMVVDTHTGTVMQRTDYDEFGLIIDEDLAENWTPVLFGYAGGLQDRDTGLIRFGARDYDPMVGRWTSKEPLGFNGSDNFYVYAENDPVNLKDINGLRIVPVGNAFEVMMINHYLDTLQMNSETGRKLVGLLNAEGMPDVKIKFIHLNELICDLKDDLTNGYSAPTRTVKLLNKLEGSSANRGEKWNIRPPEIGMAHELIHALVHITLGKTASKDESRIIGYGQFIDEEITENAIRRDYGLLFRPRH